MIYLKLFLVFAKIGLFGFGGGVAMLPVIYQNAKLFQLIDKGQFDNLVAIAQATPGPISVNAATYVGYNAAGVSGALVATMGVALPSFILVSLSYYFIRTFKDSRIVDGVFYGIRPVTVGLVASAAVFIGQGVIASSGVVPVVIFLVALGLMFVKKISPIIIILGAAVVGAIFC